MLPRVLKNFNLYIDGISLAGRIVSAKLPDLGTVDEEYRGGGMDAAIDHDQGMNKLDLTFTLSEFSDEAISRLFGNTTQVTLRGTTQRQGEATVGVEVVAEGRFKLLSRDDWEVGKNSTMQITANLTSYIEKLAGKELIKIDVINMVRVINGVDQLAGQRADLGL